MTPPPEPRPAYQVGKVAFIRVLIAGPQMTNSFIPSVPITEIDDKGAVLSQGYAHPDSIVTPAEIKMKLMTNGGSK